jgi:hypothetical protein
MLSLVTALFHFIISASDPHQACAVMHRDPGVAGTYYLYCSQTIGDVEVISVGAFVPDVKRPHKKAAP